MTCWAGHILAHRPQPWRRWRLIWPSRPWPHLVRAHTVHRNPPVVHHWDVVAPLSMPFHPHAPMSLPSLPIPTHRPRDGCRCALKPHAHRFQQSHTLFLPCRYGHRRSCNHRGFQWRDPVACWVHSMQVMMTCWMAPTRSPERPHRPRLLVPCHQFLHCHRGYQRAKPSPRAKHLSRRPFGWSQIQCLGKPNPLPHLWCCRHGFRRARPNPRRNPRKRSHMGRSQPLHRANPKPIPHRHRNGAALLKLPSPTATTRLAFPSKLLVHMKLGIHATKCACV
jgi:hypothetical protein